MSVPWLVISPHSDDAVFSCDHLLALNPGSVVLTICGGIGGTSGVPSGGVFGAGLHRLAPSAATIPPRAPGGPPGRGLRADDRPGRRILPVPLRYCGTETGEDFLVGYGLDFADLY